MQKQWPGMLMAMSSVDVPSHKYLSSPSDKSLTCLALLSVVVLDCFAAASQVWGKWGWPGWMMHACRSRRL